MDDLFTRVNAQRIETTRAEYAKAMSARRNRRHGEGNKSADMLHRACTAKLAAELGKPDPYGAARKG